MTNTNKPRVTRVNGSVRSIRIGLTMALANPKTTAAKAAATKLSNLKPGTKWAVISKATAVSSQVSKKCGMTLIENYLSKS
jgi:hypothetical protein